MFFEVQPRLLGTISCSCVSVAWKLESHARLKWTTVAGTSWFLAPRHLLQNEYFSFVVRTLKRAHGKLSHVTLAGENASQCSDETSEDGLGCGVASAHRHLSQALETVTSFRKGTGSGSKDVLMLRGEALRNSMLFSHGQVM